MSKVTIISFNRLKNILGDSYKYSIVGDRVLSITYDSKSVTVSYEYETLAKPVKVTITDGISTSKLEHNGNDYIHYCICQLVKELLHISKED